MLRIDGLRLLPGESEALLPKLAAKRLRIGENRIEALRVIRRSIDARDGVAFHYAVTVSVKQERSLGKKLPKGVSVYHKESYQPPKPLKTPPEDRPVVIGAGPAGLFCTLLLAMAGAKPILLERGKKVEERKADVEAFWQSGKLLPHSNVQFGEGGAGTFSDGKLNTGTRDLRHRFILGKLVEFGAPESILIDAKPHAGTDKLHIALIAMRHRLLELGADIRFESHVTDFHIADGAITGVHVVSSEGEYDLSAKRVVLALGHSARDTVETLFDRGVPMEPKPFAIGVRIEHLQKDMDAAQYGRYAGHPGLPVSTYALSRHVSGDRAVFSFCVCPGGQVVASASEEGRLVTNGMSVYARDGENINGGLLVNVTPEDFGSSHPLAGIAFQRRLEETAFRLGGGGYYAPAQTVGDFLAGRPSEKGGRVKPTYRPGVTWTDLRNCLPAFVCDAIKEALPELDKRLQGFAAPDAVLTAVESRSSAPVKIPRDKETLQSSIRGLYPCGEGAGYAGGILSAAADGMHAAEVILEELRWEK